jgi:hypothetical protein
MENHELVIVGGSAGGIQAAISSQKQHGVKDILVIRMEEKAMVPCGIPYIYMAHLEQWIRTSCPISCLAKRSSRLAK